MLSAIKFDRDFPFNTRKIGNVFPYGMLAADAVSIQVLVAQPLP
jgi:hypothetical protein